MGQKLETVWWWITNSKYTRFLESEVNRLRDENIQLVNSCLSNAGMPTIVQRAIRNKETKPIQGQILPSQLRRKYEQQDRKNHIVPEA